MSFKVNDKFEHTFIVSTKEYEGFIELFKDKTPLHTDDQFAVKYGFKEKIMYGNMLNGFISYFVGEMLPVKNVIEHSTELHFKNPFYLNDTLLFEAVVASIHESVNAIEFKFTFKTDTKTIAKGKVQIGLLF